LEKIKDDAKTNQVCTRNLISEAVTNVPLVVVAQLPSQTLISSTICRVRSKVQVCPQNPLTVNDLNIPLEYQVVNNKQFLLYDNKNEKRTLIFSTVHNLKILKNCNTWMADGTFRTVPKLFSQLYTIHVCYNRTTYLVVYVLMTDRTKQSYIEFLNVLKRFEPDLNPNSIMIDFEQSFILAFKDVFPNSEIKGCFFHFQQCMWRKIQENGLHNMYAKDAEFALQIRHLCALAYVPINQSVQYFNDLIESNYFVENEDVLSTTINYFEDTWIGRPNRRNGRRSPIFSTNMWNCYESVIQDLPRTNNSVEGWHHAFNAALGANHVSIWKFIRFIKKEQVLQEVFIFYLI